MATHSSVIAWRIPGTGEPDGLRSMGSHRVGHDCSDLAVAWKATANVPNSECFLPEMENKTMMSLITFFCCSHFFHHCTGDSDQCDKARKKQ